MTGKRRTKKLSDQLRAIIDASEISRYEISKQTGIDQATLSRFMLGNGGLSIEGLDLIADCLGLRLTVAKQPSTKKGG